MGIPGWILNSQLYKDAIGDRAISDEEFDEIFGPDHRCPKDIHQVLSSLNFFVSASIPYRKIKRFEKQIKLNDYAGKYLFDELEQIIRTNTLEEAIMTNNPNIVKWKVKDCLDNALVYACRHGRLDSVREMLQIGATADNDKIPLMWACKFGHDLVVKMLIDAGADVHKNNDVSIVLASRYGHDKVVKILLDNGADVSVCSLNCVRTAFANAQNDVIKLLGAHLPDDTPLTLACTYGHNEVVKLLIGAGADVRENNDTPLELACEHGRLTTVALLLDYGADVLSNNALQEAVVNDRKEIVKLLLNRGADVHDEDNIDFIFEWACLLGYEDIIELLLRLGADMSSVYYVVEAVDHDQRSIVNLLLARGSDFYEADETIFAWACEKGYQDTVDFLLRNGADIDGSYYIIQAAKLGHKAIVERLMRAGADAHMWDDEAFVVACENNQEDVVDLLLGTGANVQAQNNRALVQSLRKGHTNIVQRLLANGADIHAQDLRSSLLEHMKK